MGIWHVKVWNQAGDLLVDVYHKTKDGCVERAQSRLMALGRRRRGDRQRLCHALRNYLYTLPRDPASGSTTWPVEFFGQACWVTLETVRVGDPEGA